MDVMPNLLSHGTIIKFKNNQRCCVLMHLDSYKDLQELMVRISMKNTKNNLPFLAVYGIQNTNEQCNLYKPQYNPTSYCKVECRLTVGHLNNVEIIGHLDTIPDKHLVNLILTTGNKDK